MQWNSELQLETRPNCRDRTAGDDDQGQLLHYTCNGIINAASARLFLRHFPGDKPEINLPWRLYDSQRPP